MKQVHAHALNCDSCIHKKWSGKNRSYCSQNQFIYFNTVKADDCKQYQRTKNTSVIVLPPQSYKQKDKIESNPLKPRIKIIITETEYSKMVTF